MSLTLYKLWTNNINKHSLDDFLFKFNLQLFG